jgi:hypothetical protein
MGVYESRGQIAKGMKELLEKWAELKLSWNDANSEHIEKEFLEVLEADARSAGAAMDQMGMVLDQIRRECSEDRI